MKNEICIKMQCKLKKIQYYNVHKSELAKTTDVIFNINQLKDRIKNYIYRIVTDTGWKYKYLRNTVLNSTASHSHIWRVCNSILWYLKQQIQSSQTQTLTSITLICFQLQFNIIKKYILHAWNVWQIKC